MSTPTNPLRHPKQAIPWEPSTSGNSQFIDQYNSRLCTICERHRPNGAGWVSHKIAGWICKDCKLTPRGIKLTKVTKQRKAK